MTQSTSLSGAYAVSQGDTPENVDEEILEELEGNNEEEIISEVFQILNSLENGQIDESLPRRSAEDVAFDMDEIIIEEDNYYTDHTSDSDDESDVSSEDGVENFEL